MNTKSEEPGVIAFRADGRLITAVDSVAAKEGISRADVARRALKQDVEKRLAGVE